MKTHSSILAWEIPLDRAAWWATVYGFAKSLTRLSDLAAAAASQTLTFAGNMSTYSVSNPYTAAVILFM